MNNSNFLLEQVPNGYYYLIYDMGNSYYKGLINPELFFTAVKTNYIDVVKEAIEYFGKSSKKDPSIVSIFEYEDGQTNNFIISFTISNNFVKFSEVIKIPVEKILKTIQEYIGEQEIKILTLKTFVTAQESINNAKDTKISELETKITELENKIIDLQKSLEYTNNKSDNIVKLVLEQLMLLQNKNTSVQSIQSIQSIPNNPTFNFPNNNVNNQNNILDTNQNNTLKNNIFLPKPDNNLNPVPQISNLNFNSKPILPVQPAQSAQSTQPAQSAQSTQSAQKRTFNFGTNTSFSNFQPITNNNKDSVTVDSKTNV